MVLEAIRLYKKGQPLDCLDPQKTRLRSLLRLPICTNNRIAMKGTFTLTVNLDVDNYITLHLVSTPSH